jgi:gamma-glutamyl-gamma-aminobutyrate hydrolase PuuD
VIDILITQRFGDPNPHDEVRDSLDVRWHAFAAELGVSLVPVPNIGPPAVAVFDRPGIGGLVLSGGADVPAVSGTSTIRDRTELALLEAAIVRGVPVVGVCRGAQLIAAYFGSSLDRVDGHRAIRHEIGGDLGVRVVNSYHEWGITELGAPLVAEAAAPGSIEAFVHDQLPLLGIMWHPEREQTVDPRDLDLFRRAFGLAE